MLHPLTRPLLSVFAQASKWNVVRDQFEESKAEIARKGFGVARLQEVMLHKAQLNRVEQVRCFQHRSELKSGPKARVLIA